MSRVRTIVRWVLAGFGILAAIIFLIPFPGLIPLLAFLLLWDVVDEGLPIRLSDEDMLFLRWETE